MNGFRDVELLSSYLDGQLGPSETARLERRLNSDPDLAAVFDDLRTARGLLKRLPLRKAPRNFTLTRKMAGVKPPMPGSFSFFRFTSVAAVLLLMITFAFNSLAAQISLGASAPAPEYGIGGGPGFGGGCEEPCAEEPLLEMKAPATEAPAATEAPSMQDLALPTDLPPPAAADRASVDGTPTADATVANQAESFTQPQEDQQGSEGQYRPEFPLSSFQIGLILLGVLSALASLGINLAVKRRWK
jgi:hypothetical protein